MLFCPGHGPCSPYWPEESGECLPFDNQGYNGREDHGVRFSLRFLPQFVRAYVLQLFLFIVFSLFLYSFFFWGGSHLLGTTLCSAILPLQRFILPITNSIRHWLSEFPQKMSTQSASPPNYCFMIIFPTPKISSSLECILFRIMNCLNLTRVPHWLVIKGAACCPGGFKGSCHDVQGHFIVGK